jgi:hypothetical protein
MTRHTDVEVFVVRLLVVVMAVLVLGLVVWAVEQYPMVFLGGVVLIPISMKLHSFVEDRC